MSESNDDGRDNLPTVHPSEYEDPIDVMVETLRKLDGPMSASNAIVPKEAYDVGDDERAPERENPRASDLGYTEAADPQSRIDDEPRALVMWDDDTNDVDGAGTYVRAKDGSYINDVSLMA